MTDKWILDVLADMRAFARGNDMPMLAEQLDEASLIAAVELANRKGAQTTEHASA